MNEEVNVSVPPPHTGSAYLTMNSTRMFHGEGISKFSMWTLRHFVGEVRRLDSEHNADIPIAPA